MVVDDFLKLVGIGKFDSPHAFPCPVEEKLDRRVADAVPVRADLHVVRGGRGETKCFIIVGNHCSEMRANSGPRSISIV